MSPVEPSSAPAPARDRPPRPPGRWKRRVGWGAGALVAVVALALGGLAVAVRVVEIPAPNDFALREASVFLRADGSRITQVGVNRQPVEFAEIPEMVRLAVLAAEDRSFYDDPGVSVSGVLRAVKNNLGGGELQGGSSITQQYVKNHYLTQERTLGRKGRELLISLKIGQDVPKDDVLRDYLNTAFFARGAYGVEAAARAYFGTPVSALGDDAAKAAYLAALLQSPYRYASAPDDPEAAEDLRARWDYVLDGMVAEGWLEQPRRAALVFPDVVRHRVDELAGETGYLVDAATQYLDGQHRQDLGAPDAAMLARGGYEVVTTYRPEAMARLREGVARALEGLDPVGSAADRDVRVGAATVAESGAVLGFYGGADYLERGYNDALQASGPVGDLAGVLRRVALGDGATKDGYAERLERMLVTEVGGERGTLATTPMRLAAAFVALHGEYRQPHHVSEVRKDGKVVWRAPNAAPERKSPHPAVEPGEVAPAVPAGSLDESGQWAWSLAGGDGEASAAVLFATEPDGARNRALRGMTPLGEHRADDPAAAVRVGAVLGPVRALGW
ncbi:MULTISPECIES: transglycosylase domain-containing protein [Actinosynnema]|uniref:transglycosylase domain-containing protein n=1 Tax=Actinosynnema TaxID=40566 RepID=UPI0020A300D4|nr:transglycosylase domain-containing protein [Actinosynnema pretiosum]